jgi:peptidoglycan/xylan/chitin deacetylase (PgdA/CDA1 family)
MSITINIEKWDSCKKTAFASTWDDFCIESWKKLVSYANKKNIPLTFFINTCGYCEAGRFQKDNNLIGPETKMSKKDIEFFKKIVKQGNEIGGHTTNHYDMHKMSNNDIEKDCEEWVNILEKKKVIKKNQGLSFSYPYGYRPKSLNMLEKYFLGARAYGGGLNDCNPKNLYRLKSVNVGKMTKLEKLNKILDDAINNDKIIIEAGHGINKECWSPVPDNIIYKHFDYVNKKQKYLWCTTMVNIIKYIIQRNNLELSLKHIDQEKLIFKIKQKKKINFEIIPITISIRIPKNIKIINCIQNNKKIEIDKTKDIFFIKTSDFNHEIIIDIK